MRYVVEKDSIIHNVEVMKKHCTGARIIAVVKGNGYSLGLCEYSKLLVESGIDFLAVSRLDDAETLRAAGIDCEILLLTPPYDGDSAKKCCEIDLTVTVDSCQTAALLDRAAESIGKKAAAHFIVDTGFARFGFLDGEEQQLVEAVKACPNVDFKGIYTHLYNAYSKNISSVELQVGLFNKAVKVLEEAGFTGLMRHVCSSAAAVRFPQYHFDAVRLGSALIGRVSVANTVGLKKVGFMECPIVSKKTLPAGHFVLYGEAYKTSRTTVTAVVPIGTIDGFGMSKTEVNFCFKDKLLVALKKLLGVRHSQSFTCDVNGKTVNVIGKVGFTDIVLDVTDVNCEPGDLAVIQMSPFLVDSSIKREFV